MHSWPTQAAACPHIYSPDTGIAGKCGEDVDIEWEGIYRVHDVVMITRGFEWRVPLASRGRTKPRTKYFHFMISSSRYSVCHRKKKPRL